MTYELIISPEAEQDLNSSYLWYEDKQEGLGDRFLMQIKESLDFIVNNPNTPPVIYRDTRMFLTKSFPFKIIYLFKENRIDILAVLHGKRHPNRAKNRIDYYFDK